MQTTMLRPLVSKPGPFTSVYFEDSHDTEDAAKQLDLKLRDLRAQLAEQHAPDETCRAIETAVRQAPPSVGRSGRALLATGDSVVVDERFDEPPAAPVTRVSELPYLVPLTRYAEPGSRYVVASLDQVNATVEAFDEHGRKIGADEVSGRDHPVHRVRGGGSAQYPMREHTEETLRRNVADIADEVANVAQRTGARLVVLAGEIQGRRGVYEALPKPWQEITHEVTHVDVVPELIESEKRRRLEEVLNRFRDELGQEQGLAVQGLEAVTSALMEGNVATLLISDPPGARVYTGTEPTMIATSENQLRTLGASEVRERNADEAIPVAAVAVDADLIYVDSDLADGFGVILRHR
ncbi:hypothetical protein HFP15_35570 [Amycolatopsis sp. K13G38]|uniref:Peptide chain release factor 1 n=1 Tax=Amycolatopsis acididurans TaxID=2724524 RepID=A0ABX1JEI0_9PSEU|nr:hypothetical protein [Amycolatopsis acididurans]NKQ58187.1 hypothetical protein [Amycolatopsis acididurans]